MGVDWEQLQAAANWCKDANVISKVEGDSRHEIILLLHKGRRIRFRFYKTLGFRDVRKLVAELLEMPSPPAAILGRTTLC